MFAPKDDEDFFACYNKNAVEDYYHLVSILEQMPIPEKRRNLDRQSNVRWLRRNIQPDWNQSDVALEILKKCDESQAESAGGASPIYSNSLRNHYIDERAFVQKYLNEKKLEVSSNTRVGEPHKVYKVKLPFTPEEWMDLMNTEGEFLPACCAVISDIRDKLMATLREGGWVRATELFEIVESLKEHHDCSDENEPQAIMQKIWEDIKDEADLHLYSLPYDPSDLDDAFDLLYRSSANLSWGNLFGKRGGGEDENHNLLRLVHFARLAPAIKTVYDSLINKKYEPLVGYAVAENQKVVPLRNGGLAIFQTEEKAKELADYLNEMEDETREQNKKEKVDTLYRNKKFAEKHGKEEPRLLNVRTFVVERVEVSLEKGVVFLTN